MSNKKPPEGDARARHGALHRREGAGTCKASNWFNPSSAMWCFNFFD